jgi:hypothetical protein
MKRLVAVSIAAMMLFSSCGKSHSLLEPKQTEVVESYKDAKLEEDFNYAKDVNHNDSVGVAFLCSIGLPLLAFLDFFTSDKPIPQSTKKTLKPKA